MMLVDDAPASVDPAKAHGEAEVEGEDLSVRLDVPAVSGGGCKGNFGTCVNLNVVEFELHRPGGAGVEELPCVHVGVDAAREKGRRHVEHEDGRIMVLTVNVVDACLVVDAEALAGKRAFRQQVGHTVDGVHAI